ncbi:MAG: hypothetical protein ABIL58_06690 [Pseudomonadota bacterium]
MRLFALLNFQHVMGVVFPTLVFMVIFFIGLGYMHFRTKDAEHRKTAITHVFPDGIEDRDAPFPLFMVLIIVGVFIWAVLYITLHGALGVKIS